MGLGAVASASLAGCGSSSSAASAAGTPLPEATDPAIQTVELKDCNETRMSDLQIVIDKDGKPDFVNPKELKLRKGSVNVDGAEYALYIPAEGPYSLKGAESHFENKSTQVTVDYNRDKEFTKGETWFSSRSIRFGDRMLEVKAFDPGGRWMQLVPSKIPLGGAVVGMKAPPVEYTTLDGKKISIADMRGKALLLDIFSVT
jgi:hypothetical protein